METHIDGNTIRPYFNAGFLIVRPEIRILRKWWRVFKELYQDTDLRGYYNENKMYAIFAHQAILSAVIISDLEIRELKKLPFEYNYPLNLYFDNFNKHIPEDMNSLVSVRYEDVETLNELPFDEDLKKWILQKIGI